MTSGYRRRELQAIAEEKFADASILFGAQRFSNAYYLAGYAVEIGLKACIARQIREETLPDRDFVRKIYTHELAELVKLAGLQNELKNRLNDLAFAANWAIVLEWKPDRRYEAIDDYSSQIMIDAVGDHASGVLPWIARYW